MFYFRLFKNWWNFIFSKVQTNWVKAKFQKQTFSCCFKMHLWSRNSTTHHEHSLETLRSFFIQGRRVTKYFTTLQRAEGQSQFFHECFGGKNRKCTSKCSGKTKCEGSILATFEIKWKTCRVSGRDCKTTKTTGLMRTRLSARSCPILQKVEIVPSGSESHKWWKRFEFASLSS